MTSADFRLPILGRSPEAYTPRMTPARNRILQDAVLDLSNIVQPWSVLCRSPALRGLEPAADPAPAQELRGTPAIIHAIVRACLPAYPRLVAEGGRVQRAAADFVLSQLARLPPWLRIPLHIVLHGFNLAALFKHGRPFTRISTKRQHAHVAAWGTCRLRVRSDCIKLIRSLTLMAFYEHPSVLSRLGAERTGDRISRPKPSTTRPARASARVPA